MPDPTAMARVRAARALLDESSDHTRASIYSRCTVCASLIPRGSERAHRAWHDAVSVLAARVLGPDQT